MSEKKNMLTVIDGETIMDISTTSMLLIQARKSARYRKRKANVMSIWDQPFHTVICVREFIAYAKEIADMDKLTPKILRAFVHHIDVYEKEEKFSRKCGNPMEIHYTFQPKPRTISKNNSDDTEGTANGFRFFNFM